MHERTKWNSMHVTLCHRTVNLLIKKLSLFFSTLCPRVILAVTMCRTSYDSSSSPFWRGERAILMAAIVPRRFNSMHFVQLRRPDFADVWCVSLSHQHTLTPTPSRFSRILRNQGEVPTGFTGQFALDMSVVLAIFCVLMRGSYWVVLGLDLEGFRGSGIMVRLLFRDYSEWAVDSDILQAFHCSVANWTRGCSEILTSSELMTDEVINLVKTCKFITKSCLIHY